MRGAENVISAVETIVSQMTPVITITANVAEGSYWKLSMCRTYWMRKDMRITIDGDTYRIRSMVKDEYIIVSGTAQPGVTTFQLLAPIFWHGSHRKVNAERVTDGYDKSREFVYLPIPEVRELDEDDAEVQYEATIRPLFLLPYDKRYDKIDLQQSMYIEPANEMADYFYEVLETLDSYYEIQPGIIRREWMNFGDEAVWGKDKLIFNQDLSGVETRGVLDVFYGVDCCGDNETITCAPVNFYLNGTFEESIDSGDDFQLTVVDDNDVEVGTYDEATNTVTVPAAGSGIASQTFNGGAVTDQDSGTTKAITVKDSGGANVGTKGTDTALALDITIADALNFFNGSPIDGAKAEGNKTITVFNSNAINVGVVVADSVDELEIEVANSTVSNSDDSYSTSVFAEDDLELPDITVTINGASQGSFPSVKNLSIDASNIIYIRPANSGYGTTSYLTGDEGYNETNYPAPSAPAFGVPAFLDPTDPKMLLNNNAFGHKHRFTGVNGGYYDYNTAQYKLADGTVSDQATTFGTAAGLTSYMIDNHTGLGWKWNVQGAGTWSTQVTNILALNHASHTDWFLPSRLQLYSLYAFHNLGVILTVLLPFNSAGIIKTSTPSFGNETTSHNVWTAFSAYTQLRADGNVDNAYACRWHF